MSKHSQILPPHFRWNFGAFTVDYVCFSIAITFASISSVMPAFVGHLTDSAPVIGLVSSVFQGGWLLPQLAIARLINDKPRKKPYMLAGISGRVMFWAIALGLWAGLAHYPTTMLVLFFVALGLFSTTDGLASVAWLDILARAIPLRQRGRLIGLSQFVGGLGGIGVGALVGVILEQWLFPHNYALLFALAGIVLIPSAVAIFLIREPPPKNADPEEQEKGQTQVRTKVDWSKIVADPVFRRLITCRLFVGMIGLTNSFYVIHARDVLHLPQSIIGQFVMAQTAAGVVASILLGLVSERWGPRYVARIGSAVAITGPLFALAAHLTASGWIIQAYPFVYMVMGFVQSMWMLGFTNYMLEIAPDEMRPAYVGLGNTIMGSLTFVPMIGGWLLEVTSYTVLFGATATIVATGFLLTLSLKPARQAAPELANESA
ncbi:MAG: MFS transporter [Chloroflexi bacterium]|nr:MFS transporter [Chloroflexota bacterium]